MSNYLNIDLQLFADDDGDTGGVVDHQNYNEDNDINDIQDEVDKMPDDDSDEAETDQEVADPDNEEQSPEDNREHKKTRREHEAEKKAIEAERMAIKAEREELERLRYEREAQQAEQRVYNEMLTEDNIEAKEYERSVDRDTAIQLLKFEAQKLVMDERNKVSEKIKRNQAQKDELRNDPDESEYFKLLEKDVDEIIKNNPHLDLHFETVYGDLRVKRRKELNKAVKSNIEKNVTANIQDRMRRKTVSSDGGSDERVNPTAVLSEDEMEMTRAMGNDPRNIAKYLRTNLKNKKG